MKLSSLRDALVASRGFAHKRDIGHAMDLLGSALPEGIAIGDDCATIPDGDGHLLFAIEGFVDDFVERMPWFAGYCGVMVNASDIYAMGGRPIAVVDALWSDGVDRASPVFAGLAEASRRYGIPLAGGHTNLKSGRGQLAVAILGRAKRLLTSFDARPGDALLMAIDLRGKWQDPFPYWNASTDAPPGAPAGRPRPAAATGRAEPLRCGQGHQHGGRARDRADAARMLEGRCVDRRRRHPATVPNRRQRRRNSAAMVDGVPELWLCAVGAAEACGRGTRTIPCTRPGLRDGRRQSPPVPPSRCVAPTTKRCCGTSIRNR